MQTLKSYSGKIVFALCLLLLVSQAGTGWLVYARQAGLALSFPYPLDYGEGPILNQALTLARGQTLYRSDLSIPPYTITANPPLFPLFQVPFAWLFGPGFGYGRALSILGTLLAGVFIGLSLYTLTRDVVASIVGGLLLPVFPYVLHWSMLDRPDGLALGLSWIGMYVLLRASHRRAGLVVTSLMFTAAIYTRQTTMLAAPLTALLWLWQEQKRRQALELALWTGGLCVGLFLLTNLLTGGGFYLHLIQSDVRPFSLQTVAKYWIIFCLDAPYLILSSLGFVITERLGHQTRSWPLVAPYLLTTLLASLAVGKAVSYANPIFEPPAGSNVNYLLESAAALSLATGATVAWARQNYWAKSAIVLLLAIQVGILVNVSKNQYVDVLADKARPLGEVAQLARLVDQAQGPVLADEYMGLLPLTGQSLYFMPIEFRQLSEANRWNEEPLVSAIQKRQFAAILLYEPPSWAATYTRWTPRLRNAIRSLTGSTRL